MEKNFYTEEEKYWCTGGNTGTLPDRITPSGVNVLEPNEVFVFGSNFEGRHIGGAARAAKEKFGAVWGIGEGLQGQSYAIPTMEGLDNIKPAVERFTSFARQHQELKFFVTAIGCGIAGYKVEEIAPLFNDAAYLQNVYLPLDFWKFILSVADSPEDIQTAAKNIIDLCSYMHKNNIPRWNERTDEAIFNSLERWHMWALGVKLGVISSTEKEPQIKVLPEELRNKILNALKGVTNNSENRPKRVLIVGGYQNQRELIEKLCRYYDTTFFAEYDGGKTHRLHYIELRAKRLYFIDGYHIHVSSDDYWDLILVMPEYDETVQRFLDERPRAQFISYLDSSIEGGCYQHAINTIQQCLRISNQ